MPTDFNIGQRLRLISGLIMFVFVTSHLLNHATGLVSLDFMQECQRFFLGFWTSLPGAIFLSAALLTHLFLVSLKQIQRRTWRMPLLEIVRLFFGLSVLVLLTAHVLGNFVLFRLPGAESSYAFYLFKLWPGRMFRQSFLLVAAWSHGCIGVHGWLRLREGYRRFLPLWYALALLLPAAALAGILSSAREAQLLGLNSVWTTALQASTPKPDPDLAASISPWWKIPSIFASSIVCLVLVSRAIWFLRKHRDRIEISYPSGKSVIVAAGASVLEASRIGSIPHASVCGGRGRCSTCRIQILHVEPVPHPSRDELEVLARISAPPGVRLACQFRPAGSVSVVPLVSPGARPSDALPDGLHLFGHEMKIAILFSDLRDFTKLSEQKLPFDVVHILNQYCDTMGAVIESSGGHVDKFIGDGVMALFGLNGDADHGCGSALAAARAMELELSALNDRFAGDLSAPLRMGIGIHVGPVIVGKIGRKSSSTLTAIGDAVNVASRLEGLTKQLNCGFVIAAEVAQLAALDTSDLRKENVMIRGRTQSLTIYAIPRGFLPSRS